MNKEESEQRILNNKGCNTLRCDDCYYHTNEYTNCKLKLKREKYKQCRTKFCYECNWDWNGDCEYLYLEEITKLNIMKEILK